MNVRNKVGLSLIIGLIGISASHAQRHQDIAKFPSRVAKQAVVVDSSYMYAISNKIIVKYTLKGDSLLEWRETESESIIHMNSGSIIGDKLDCVNSNFPEIPMTSSIEIFDKKTLKHVDHVSLGIRYGSLTWIVKKDNSW